VRVSLVIESRKELELVLLPDTLAHGLADPASARQG
jgi:hypothetical protein